MALGTGPSRPGRSRVPRVVEHVLDRAPHGELQRDPDEHGQHDGADDADHQPAVAGPRDAREDRDEVDELEGELAHDRRHGQAHDQHVGGGERRHGERPATAADEQRGPGEHGEGLHRPRVATRGRARRRCARARAETSPTTATTRGEHHVLAAQGRAGPLPRVVGTEVGAHPGPRARAGGPGGSAGRHTDQRRQPHVGGPPPAGGCRPVQRTGVSTSRPTWGRSASGTTTDPSGCWWFSRMATSQRVVARVPLSVAATSLPCSPLNRVLSRRAWKVVQLEVEVSSR